MTEQEFLTRFDNQEKFSERELSDLRWEFKEIETNYGDNRRWTRSATTIFQIGERYFALDWEEGLTESQENEFWDQPYEVYPKEVTRVVTGTIYSKEAPKQELMIGTDGVLTPVVQNQIVAFEKQAKAVKEAQDKLKEAILKEMEEKGIIKLDSEELTITYIAPTYSEKFDSKALKADNEELYNKYIKLSKVKSSVRIKVK